MSSKSRPRRRIVVLASAWPKISPSPDFQVFLVAMILLTPLSTREEQSDNRIEVLKVAGMRLMAKRIQRSLAHCLLPLRKGLCRSFKVDPRSAEFFSLPLTLPRAHRGRSVQELSLRPKITTAIPRTTVATASPMTAIVSRDNMFCRAGSTTTADSWFPP